MYPILTVPCHLCQSRMHSCQLGYSDVSSENKRILMELKCVNMARDVKRKPDFDFRNEIRFYTFGKRNSNLFPFSFSSSKLQKNYKMSHKINSHICLMLSVYKSFHQTVKYGRHRNHNNYTLKLKFLWRSIKPKLVSNRFSTTEIRFAKIRY